MNIFVWQNPLPIQINTSEAAAIVTANITIWIHAWYKFEYVGLQQILDAFSGKKVPHHSVKNKVRVSLSRMDSCCDTDSLSLSIFNSFMPAGSHRYYRDWQPANALSKYLSIINKFSCYNLSLQAICRLRYFQIGS